MRKLKQFFQINNDEANPLMVQATINAQLEDNQWTWAVDQIHTVEIAVGDKEGIDITRQVLSNPRALALITAQTADCEDQIMEALAHQKTAVA